MADEHTTAFAGAGLPTCKALRKVCETFSFLKVDQYLGQTLHALSGWRELMVAAFCKVVVASAVFLSCYFHCRLLPLWVECDGADRLPISRCT